MSREGKGREGKGRGGWRWGFVLGGRWDGMGGDEMG